jgi:hypothetical protein
MLLLFSFTIGTRWRKSKFWKDCSVQWSRRGTRIDEKHKAASRSKGAPATIKRSNFLLPYLLLLLVEYIIIFSFAIGTRWRKSNCWRDCSVQWSRKGTRIDEKCKSAFRSKSAHTTIKRSNFLLPYLLVEYIIIFFSFAIGTRWRKSNCWRDCSVQWSRKGTRKSRINEKRKAFRSKRAQTTTKRSNFLLSYLLVEYIIICFVRYRDTFKKVEVLKGQFSSVAHERNKKTLIS